MTDAALSKLRAWQPGAQDVRLEGRCPACKDVRLLSYTLDSLRPHPDPDREHCGHWCPTCGFSGATSRDKTVEPQKTSDFVSDQPHSIS